MEVEICSQDLNNRAFKLLVHLYTCDKIHVILYVFIHDPFLSHSSINPGPITSLQFSLAGFGNPCHIRRQCRMRNVRQSDLVLVHLTNSLHQCRPKVGLGVLVVASEDESLPSLQVHCGGPRIPGLILALLSRGAVPVDGSQHEMRRHH